MNGKKIKVAIITNIIAPYRIPLFNFLSKKEELDLRIFFCSKSSPERKWEIPKERLSFNYKVLRSLNFKLRKSGNQPSIFFINPTLIFHLIKLKPDVIVSAEFSFASIIGFLFSKFLRKKYVCWSDEAKLPKPAFRKHKIFRYFIRKIIIRGSSTFIASSTVAKENFIYYGVDPNKIFISYLTTDIAFFRKKAEDYLLIKESLKRKMGWDSFYIILYCGYLWRRKGLVHLLKAINMLHKKKDNLKLIIIGDGPIKNELKDYCMKEQLEENVVFIGNKSQEELPLYYALADIFVFPSLFDPFGIVVIEALACGLPIVCSKFAGASKDAIIENVNGYVVDPTEIENLAQKIEMLLKNSQLRIEMSSNTHEILKKFSPEKAAVEFGRAVLAARGINEDIAST